MLERELARLERSFREAPGDPGVRRELARHVARTGRLPAGLAESEAVVTLLRLLEVAPEARGLADLLLARVGWRVVPGREVDPGVWWVRSRRLAWGDDHWYDRVTGVPLRVRVEGEGLELCWIPPGELTVRGTAWTPARALVVERGFFLARVPTTLSAYARHRAGVRVRPGEGELPVSEVDFAGAVAYCRALTAALGSPSLPRLRYALPGADQWEYACRAGTTATTYASPLTAIAWFRGNSGGRAQPAGEKLPNGFGLHDTLGCVWEWTRSTDGDPGALRPADRFGREGPPSRVVARGGCALSSPHQVRASASLVPGQEFQGRRLVGFRVAAFLDEPGLAPA